MTLAIVSLTTTAIQCPFMYSMIQIFHKIACLFIEFHRCYVKILHLFYTVIIYLFLILLKFATTSTAKDVTEKEVCMLCKKEISSIDEGTINTREEILTSADAEILLQTLGLWSEEDADCWYDGKCRDCRLMDGADQLLEEKEASLDELKEAFSVFDRNGDGYITPMELRRLMVMLGFRDGMRFERCRKMVEAFDEDGDGRVCFSEFKRMMECAR